MYCILCILDSITLRNMYTVLLFYNLDNQDIRRTIPYLNILRHKSLTIRLSSISAYL